MIERVLLLIRNILHIPPDQTEERVSHNYTSKEGSEGNMPEMVNTVIPCWHWQNVGKFLSLVLELINNAENCRWCESTWSSHMVSSLAVLIDYSEIIWDWCVSAVPSCKHLTTFYNCDVALQLHVGSVCLLACQQILLNSHLQILRFCTILSTKVW